MSEKPKNDVSEQVRNLVDRGNSRRLILKTSDGRQFAELSLTMAVIIGVVLLFLPMTWLIVLFAIIFAIMAKLRIEVVRELSGDDNIINMPNDDDRV